MYILIYVYIYIYMLTPCWFQGLSQSVNSVKLTPALPGFVKK